MSNIEKFTNGDLGKALTMSSREIAEMCEKDHKHVLRDIQGMLEQLYPGGMPNFGHTYTNPQNGQTYPEYHLPKRETLILVSGYRVDLRAKIVDRWQELEAKAANPYQDLLPKNFKEAVQMLACTLQENEALQAKANELAGDLQIAEPKARALDRIANTDGTFCMTHAAKDLNVNPKQLITWLDQNNWIYKRHPSNTWLAYQDKLKRGLLAHKTTVVTRNDGTEKVCDQVRVTGKGLAQLAVAFNQNQGAN